MNLRSTASNDHLCAKHTSVFSLSEVFLASSDRSSDLSWAYCLDSYFAGDLPLHI